MWCEIRRWLYQIVVLLHFIFFGMTVYLAIAMMSLVWAFVSVCLSVSLYGLWVHKGPEY